MGSVNKVILIGNLGADPELKYTPSSRALCNLRIATTDVFKDKSGQRQERTEWHNVDLWGKPAESLKEYLVKGKQVYVEGRIQTDEYTDKDGIKRKSTKVRCDKVVLLGSGSGRGGGMSRSSGGDDMGGHASGPGHDAPDQPLTDDDIPF